MMRTVNFREICRKKGIGLTKLSRMCGIPQPSLSRYQSGRSDITLRQLNRIALAVSCELNDILQEKPDLLDMCLRKIARRKKDELFREDKSWVSQIVCDLNKHYLNVKR
ncbi:MAG: helix-turn-helix domain-containing protein [Candidatus Omnitrophota bacterium]